MDFSKNFNIEAEASLIVLHFVIFCVFVFFLCTAVHAILSYMVSFSLLFFLYIFLRISACLGNDKKYKEKESEMRYLHELLYTERQNPGLFDLPQVAM